MREPGDKSREIELVQGDIEPHSYWKADSQTPVIEVWEQPTKIKLNFNSTRKGNAALRFAGRTTARFKDVKIGVRREWGIGQIEELRFEAGEGILAYHQDRFYVFDEKISRGPANHWRGRIMTEGDINTYSLLLTKLRQQAFLQDAPQCRLSLMRKDPSFLRCHEITKAECRPVFKYALDERETLRVLHAYVLAHSLSEGGELENGLPYIPDWLRPLNAIMERSFHFTAQELDWVVKHHIASETDYGQVERLERLRNHIGWDNFSERYSALIEERIAEGMSSSPKPVALFGVDSRVRHYCRKQLNGRLKRWFSSEHGVGYSVVWGYGTYEPTEMEFECVQAHYEAGDGPANSQLRLKLLEYASRLRRWISLWPCWDLAPVRMTRNESFFKTFAPHDPLCVQSLSSSDWRYLPEFVGLLPSDLGSLCE